MRIEVEAPPSRVTRFLYSSQMRQGRREIEVGSLIASICLKGSSEPSYCLVTTTKRVLREAIYGQPAKDQGVAGT
jgi:hypothetical protein